MMACLVLGYVLNHWLCFDLQRQKLRDFLIKQQVLRGVRHAKPAAAPASNPAAGWHGGDLAQSHKAPPPYPQVIQQVKHMEQQHSRVAAVRLWCFG